MSETATEATIPQTNTKKTISMDSLTKNLAELGSKIQTGAAEFAEKHELEKKVQPLKQKAEALTAKAGEAIAGVTKGKSPANETEEASGDSSRSPAEDGEAGEDGEDGTKAPKRNIVRDSINGFTSKIKPKLEEVSIADILNKAKSKVFGGETTDAEKPSTAAPGEADSTSLTVMKQDVDDLASEMESTAEDVSNKKEVQKLLVPIFAKLKLAQDKFAAMVEARKKKRQEESEAAAAAAAAGGDTDQDESGQSPQKKLLVTAETAVKKAFENAEKIARKVAKKAGIFDDGKETTVPTTEDEEGAASSSPAAAEEPETPPAAQPEPTPAADSAEPKA